MLRGSRLSIRKFEMMRNILEEEISVRRTNLVGVRKTIVGDILLVVLVCSLIPGRFAEEEEISCVQFVALDVEQEFTSSGDYPHSYKDYTDDCWVIRADSANRSVELKVVDSRIESHFLLFCSWVDYIDVRDGDNADADRLLLWCGNGVPPGGPFYSTGDALYVHFHTDFSIHDGGFKMQYKSLPREEADQLRRPFRGTGPGGRNRDNEDESQIHEQSETGIDWRPQHRDDWLDHRHDTLHKGVVAAIVVGCLILLLLLAFGAYFLTRCYKESQQRRRQNRHGATGNSRSVVAATNLRPEPIVFSGAAVGGYLNRSLSSGEIKKEKMREPPAYSEDNETTTLSPDSGAAGEMQRGGALPAIRGDHTSAHRELGRGGVLPPISRESAATRQPGGDYVGPASPPPPYVPEDDALY